MKIETMLDILGYIGSILSIFAAGFAWFQKKEIVKYRIHIENRLKVSDHKEINAEAQKINAIIIKYKSGKLLGSNKQNDNAKLLGFITKIKEYSYLLSENAGNEYFNKMEMAINTSDYNSMYMLHSDLIQKLKKESSKELLCN